VPDGEQTRRGPLDGTRADRVIYHRETMPMSRPKRRRLRRALLVIGSIVPEALAIRSRGYGLGGNVVVRCQRGHLFTTIWIPGGSLKAVRLGLWRIQRCPVGHHWSVVTPVRKVDLSKKQRRAASRQHDIRIP